MKTRKILRRILTIAIVLLLIPLVGSWALFQDRAFQENNTFATGSVALKLFFDCAGDGQSIGLDESTFGEYDNPMIRSDEMGVVVKCLQGGVPGVLERSSLFYSDVVDGAYFDPSGQAFNKEQSGIRGDWSFGNNWFDALSSAFDYTYVVPGFKTYAGVTPVAEEGDIVSLGNAGSETLSDVMMSASYEKVNDQEAQEPLDGSLPGGDKVDPLTDGDWVTQVGRAYDSSLGTVIEVVVERVKPDETVIETVYSGTFDGLVAGGPVTIFPASTPGLEPNEVTYLRFNWSMDPMADQSFQNKVFDYQINFDSI